MIMQHTYLDSSWLPPLSSGMDTAHARLVPGHGVYSQLIHQVVQHFELAFVMRESLSKYIYMLVSCEAVNYCYSTQCTLSFKRTNENVLVIRVAMTWQNTLYLRHLYTVK